DLDADRLLHSDPPPPSLRQLYPIMKDPKSKRSKRRGAQRQQSAKPPTKTPLGVTTDRRAQRTSPRPSEARERTRSGRSGLSLRTAGGAFDKDPLGGHHGPSSTTNQPPTERSEGADAKRTKRAKSTNGRGGLRQFGH